MKYLLLVSSIMLFHLAQAQDRFFTKSGKISFYSKAPLEDIEATHRGVSCVLDTKSGAVQFAVLMKGFEFRKALMQEHFNESYVESDKYPKAGFNGQIVNNSSVNYTKDGVYPATVKGKLTIHGETKEVETQGKLELKQGKMQLNAEFNIVLSDYKISIPSLVKDKVSQNIRITVDCLLEPLK
jgi:hypothetical protein